VLVTEANRKQLVGNALRALAGGTRTKDAAPSSMRWNCSMATASTRRTRATRRRC
jgi:hypothetical protein